MSKLRHLVVSVSGHGFGHVAQTAPILNALHQRCPQLRITVRSSAPESHLRSRIHAPFDYLNSTGDIGMMMSSALAVDVEKSRSAYHAFHADWDARVTEEAHLLRSLGADRVFSNVGYLPLAGAQRAGIPNVALCSLNWADIYRHYCCDGTDTRDEIIAAQIQSSYAGADVFWRATPGMAMSNLVNVTPVAPIASIGIDRRIELNRHLKLSAHEKLVLVSMGGISSRLPVKNWPRLAGGRYLMQANCWEQHPDAINFEALPFSFSDLLASSDVLLCKPGYGSFVEATGSGVPVLYVNRPDWPESPALIAWLKQQGTCREMSQQALENGDFSDALTQILNAPAVNIVTPNGAEQVAHYLAEH
ncbi:MAG TPA: hypothetical protein DE312_06890 [Gallionella sp.]|nr:MAG: hypothetical protein A2Z87_13145 [Gallionellales bacterium GWA2_54_124]HCI53026.1 hypothetical protein [Gallionella sp.]